MNATSTDVQYLGLEDGRHVWADGTRLPILFGFDISDDDDEEIEDPKGMGDYKRARSARQAGKYRVQRNEARRERDELRQQLAFVRAAGARFQDVDAAWALVDRSLLVVDDSGNVAGADDAVAALCDADPSLLAPAHDTNDTKQKDDTPFKNLPSTRRVGVRRPRPTYDVALLEARYPALRRR